MKTTSPLQPLLSTKIVRTFLYRLYFWPHLEYVIYATPFIIFCDADTMQKVCMLVKMIQQVPQRLRLFVFSHRRIGKGLTSKVCITHGLLESPSELTFTPLARQTLCAQTIKCIQK